MFQAIQIVFVITIRIDLLEIILKEEVEVINSEVIFDKRDIKKIIPIDPFLF